MEKFTDDVTRWAIIKEKSLVKLILQSYADPDTKKILDAALAKPRIIQEIIEISKLPQTSSYRKANSLIKHGLLIADGYVNMKYGKKVTKYVSLFENVEINIIKNDVSIRAKLGENSRQAVFRMPDDKGENLHKKRKSTRYLKDKTLKMEINVNNMDSDSVIPYLVKERIIKV